MNIVDECIANQGFPFKSKLSFTNLIGYWEAHTHDPNPFRAACANEIVKRVSKVRAFASPIEDLSILDKNKDLVDTIMSAVFPPAIEDEMVAAVVPFSKDTVFESPAYTRLMQVAGSYDALVAEIDAKKMMGYKMMNAYAMILEAYYGITMQLDRYFVYTLKDPKTGLKKHYKVEINPSFCNIVLRGELPKLSDRDIKHLTDNLYNMEEWIKMLPPHLFEFQGVIIFKLKDQTNEEVLSRIKDDLLERDSLVNKDGFEQLEKRFRSLLQLPDLKLGITAYQKSKNGFMNFGNRIIRSIIMGENESICCHATNHSLREWFSHHPEPLVIDDLANSSCMGDFEHRLANEGLGSLILGPLFYNNEFVGLLELATPHAGDLNTLAMSKVKSVLPLFAIAVKRSSDELESKVQSVIKEKYTSIHPTVEWKFEEAAHDFLSQELEDENPTPMPIVFEDVYPLYAASDIRNSSIERNKAINADLKKQLSLARKVLQEAYRINELPVLEETIYRIDNYTKTLKRKLITGDEVSIIGFLQQEVEPIIHNMVANHPDFKDTAALYSNSLDKNLGVVYKARKAFEDSLTEINKVTTGILEEEEVKAQAMFPHFFEKYKTDGVEHNIYVGASLSEKKIFDPMHLRNLRLWQLMVTAEIARRTAAMIDELPLPLETTHLVLVHNAPLSIRFRMDEKKFDVDGAYNIRYEIIKKRIDKALVKGTDQRITQPGKIAIIYSQDKDAEEYMTYIDFLRSKDMLLGDVEHLELEELQGVSGLRALRVAVNIQQSSILHEVENILQTSG